MEKFKVFFLLLLIVGGLFTIYKQPTKLGLDLQGGLHLVLEAEETETQSVTRDSILGSIEVIRNRIDKLGLTGANNPHKRTRQNNCGITWNKKP